MIGFVLFAPAAVAVLLGAVFRHLQEWRARVLLYAVGAVAGVTLFVVASSDESWRTVTLGPASAIAGAAIACSFVLAAVLDLRTDRWRVPTLVGIAGTSTVLAVSNDWLVPGLLFWTCSTLALAAIGRDAHQGASLWVTLFASDALLYAALVGWGLSAERWTMPGTLEGWMFYLALAAIVLRSGVVPYFGVWRMLDSQAVSAIPIVAGGAFALGERFVFGSAPLEAAALIATALVVALWGTIVRNPPFAVMGTWPIALLLGAALASRSAATAASLGAVIAVSLFALWPQASSAAPARGIVLAFVPPGVGFWAVLAAATYSFGRIIEAPDVLEETSWVVVSALLPFAVATAVSVGARVARARGDVSLKPAVVASWGLLAVSFVAGLFPEAILDLDEAAVPDPSRTGLLFGAALVLGAAGGWFARKRTWAGRTPHTGAPRNFRHRGPTLGRRSLLALDWTALTLGIGTVAAAAWITLEGLRSGFL